MYSLKCFDYLKGLRKVKEENVCYSVFLKNGRISVNRMQLKSVISRLFTLPKQMLPIIMVWIQNVSLLVSNASELSRIFYLLCLLCVWFLTAEAFVGKGIFEKRINYHAKGKCGLRIRPECRLTVVVRELTSEEEAEIARLRVHNFRKLTKRERQLVPHQLIETTPVWNRKGKNSNREPRMDA